MKRKFYSLIMTLFLLITTLCGCECEHDYKLKTEKSPTCAIDGFKIYECNNCQDSYTEEIPNDDIQHKWGIGSFTKHSSCTEPGIITYPCLICDETKTEYIYKEHIPLTIFGEEPSCQKGGITDGAKCYTCGEILVEQKTLAKLDCDINDNGLCSMCGKNFYSFECDVFSGELNGITYDNDQIIYYSNVSCTVVNYSKSTQQATVEVIVAFHSKDSKNYNYNATLTCKLNETYTQTSMIKVGGIVYREKSKFIIRNVPIGHYTIEFSRY